MYSDIQAVSINFVPSAVGLIPPLPEELERELRKYLEKTYPKGMEYEILDVVVRTTTEVRKKWAEEEDAKFKEK